MKNNKVMFFLFAFFSFIFFSSVVKADTTISISDSYMTYYHDRISNMITIADTYLSSLDSTFTSYVINFRPETNSDGYNIIVYYYKGSPTYNYSNNTFNNSYLSGTQCFYYDDLTLRRCSNFSNSQQNVNYIAYASIPLTWNFCNDTTYVFTNGNNSYTDSCQIGGDVPTIYYLDELWSVPPDDTPVLTEFYTTIFDKLSVITTYFMEEYIFLSIFVVIILLTIIFYLRRFFYGS